MGFLNSGYIRVLAGVFHIWSSLYTFSPLTPLPLSLIILSPGVTLGTPISLALLVRCFATFLISRNNGTGFVRQSNSGSPIMRSVPYLAKDIPHIAE